MTDYVDVREIHPEYTTVPCRECDRTIWVDRSFTHHHDEAFCHEHSPLHETAGESIRSQHDVDVSPATGSQPAEQDAISTVIERVHSDTTPLNLFNNGRRGGGG